MHIIRLFSLSSFCHTDYWWYWHQVEVQPFHIAGFHSCGSLIWSKAEPHLEILWGSLAFGVRILHWSLPLFDICPIKGQQHLKSELWFWCVCVFRFCFFWTKLHYSARRSTFACSMSYIFWKLLISWFS